MSRFVFEAIALDFHLPRWPGGQTPWIMSGSNFKGGPAVQRVVCLVIVIAIAVALASPRPLRADDPPDGPKRIFRDDFIENMVGDWKVSRKIRGTVVENKLKAEWVLNHQFLQLHMKDVANPPAYEAIVLIGYVHSDQKYVAHWCDTFGGKFSAIGYGKRVGQSIEFEFQYPSGPFYNTMTWDPQAKGWTMRGESRSKDGQRVFFAEDTIRRP
ncbi:MAG: hypothetical protein K1X57_14215 [Gemmataceae bacterium]|nr:hypothetical protein [Gemmataceae bacterium]